MLIADAKMAVWIVGIEPSCILTLRDELPHLVRDGRTKALAAASVTLEEFLASLPIYRPGRLKRRALVHGHCHQKALVGMEPTRQVLSKVEGLEFSILDSGCCGMAGSFGYEQGHYEVSQACGERVRFPAVRGTAADDLVVAPGFSCRHQIADFCDNRHRPLPPMTWSSPQIQLPPPDSTVLINASAVAQTGGKLVD
ncbi:MAG TPA: (Fe-S)-binding protein [Longimicrobium sp.]